MKEQKLSYTKKSKENKEVGKEHTIYSDPNGINLFEKKKVYPGITHDNSNVPGWNN